MVGQEAYRFVGARISQGSILLHSKDLRPIENSYPRGLVLELGKHRISQQVWDNCNCYPRTGYSFTFWDFDNRDVLGYGFTGLYFVEPVFGAMNRFSFSLRAAAGFSLQSNPYDEKDNPDNLSYSTYWGIPLQLGLSFHYKLGPKWMLDLNGVLNHISNGGLKEPNKGINWPTLSMGVSKYLTEPDYPKREKTNWREKTIDLDRLDLTTYTTYYSPSSQKYLWSIGLEAKYAKRIARLSNLSLAMDWIYDQSKALQTTDQGASVDGNNLGLALGHEFILGRFLFAQQFAIYLIRPETQLNDVYQRYTLMYQITDRMIGGIGLKSHGHVADFGDFRIGYSF